MAIGPAEEQNAAPRRTVNCKDYHRPRTAANTGRLRNSYHSKSLCPSWASDPELQQALIDDALEDPSGNTDSQGRPKTLWNAVDGRIFVGVSCNLREPRYNCFPEIPPCGRLYSELQRRAERTLDEVRPGGGAR